MQPVGAMYAAGHGYKGQALHAVELCPARVQNKQQRTVACQFGLCNRVAKARVRLNLFSNKLFARCADGQIVCLQYAWHGRYCMLTTCSCTYGLEPAIDLIVFATSKPLHCTQVE